MKKLIIILMLCASSVFAADRFLIIGIAKTASTHDKLALLSVINKYLDPDYTSSMTITIHRIDNPSVEALVGCWDVGARHFPFTKQQALNYFASHAADFDNVNNIRIMADDEPLKALRDAGWEK